MIPYCYLDCLFVGGIWEALILPFRLQPALLLSMRTLFASHSWEGHWEKVHKLDCTSGWRMPWRVRSCGIFGSCLFMALFAQSCTYPQNAGVLAADTSYPPRFGILVVIIIGLIL